MIAVKSVQKINWIVYSSIAIGFNLFMTYVDEGLNSFEWMRNPLDWISFIVYVLGIMLGQVILEKKILKRYTGKGKLLLSSFGGVIIGIPIVFLFMLMVYLVMLLF
jgi:hypothetical protein